MSPAIDLHGIAQYSALRILESLLEGTVIFAFAGLFSRFARRESAGNRFAIWFSALIAIALAPVFTGVWSSQMPNAGTWLSRPALTVPDSWAVYFFAGWALVSGWLLLGVGRALWRLRILRKSCTSVDVSSLDPALGESLCSAPGEHPVALCTSEQVRVPTAIGFVRPMIVVPRWVMEELSPAELKQIFLHEMAHLRRHDDWTNLMLQVVKALFFFHPAVWWIEKNIALEREIACDDAVLAATQSPRAYAECLTHLAERSFIQRSVALAQAALGRIRQTSARVALILDSNRPQGTRSWRPAAALISVFAIACSIGASKFRRLVAFEDDAPTQLAQRVNPEPAASVPGSVPASYVRNASFSAERMTQPARPAKAKLIDHSPGPQTAARATTRPAVVKPKANPMIHLATSKATLVPIGRTVVLLIQGTEQDPVDGGVYAIQMWRVTVLRYVIEPASNTTPRKQT